MKSLAVLGFSFLLSVIISFSGFIYNITNKSIEIALTEKIGIVDLIKINNAINKIGYRNINNTPYFFDKYLKFFYNKFKIKTYYLKEKPFLDNIFSLDKFYLTSSDLVSIDSKMLDYYFYQFVLNKGNHTDFTEINNLNINKRIIYNQADAKPVCFYKAGIFHVYNRFNLIDKKVEKQIEFNYKSNDLMVAGFAGDFVIEGFVKYSINNIGLKYSLNDVYNIISSPDIMSANLEFTITKRNSKEPKSFNFKADENELKLLSDSPIDLVSCANNHAMDYGIGSLLDTIYYLNKNRIYHSGTGKNIYDAFSPVRIIKKNNYFSFYSICDVPDERHYKVMETLKVTNNKPGVAYYDETILKNLFDYEKKNNFINIIQLHGGHEYETAPTKKLQSQARKLIDLGAEAVICHHPHVISGVEIYNNKLIAYSLGNFLLDIRTRKNANEGIILYLYFLNNKIVGWNFFPVYSEFGAVKIDNARCKDIEKRFLELTANLNHLSSNKK